jgi:hypothetical protein
MTKEGKRNRGNDNRKQSEHSLERRDPSWKSAVLVCRKCGKRNEDKLDGLDSDAVRKALKESIGRGKHAPRVLETGCQDVCPKGIYVSFLGMEGMEGAVVREASQIAMAPIAGARVSLVPTLPGSVPTDGPLVRSPNT